MFYLCVRADALAGFFFFVGSRIWKFVGNAGRRVDRVGLAVAERFAGKEGLCIGRLVMMVDAPIGYY